MHPDGNGRLVLKRLSREEEFDELGFFVRREGAGCSLDGKADVDLPTAS